MPRLLILFPLAFLAIAGAACREDGSVQVEKIAFEGNRAVTTGQLKAVISTQENGFLPFSAKHYFDRPEFDLDLKRIEAYYADQGYPAAKIVGVDVRLNDAKDKVSIAISINEGEPITIESVNLEGLDGIPADHRAELQSRLPLVPGRPRNQSLVLAARDMVVAELRDHGFPYGIARAVERPGSTPNSVRLVIAADPGPAAVFGAITIEGNLSVDENVIRRELAFHEGDQYRVGAVTETQRRLYGLELFQFVNITPRLRDDRPTQVPVVITVAEGKHRRLQLGIGYGSEEKARARVNWRHVNFFGGARTMEAEAKWSSLEHGVRGTLTEPYFLASGTSLHFTGSSWWANEPTYEYRSTGGRIIVTRVFGRTPAGVTRGAQNRLQVSLINEHESYSIANAALEDLALREQLIALGLDPRTGEGDGRLSAIEAEVVRDTSGQPLDPRRGYRISAHVETAADWLGGSFRYSEFAGEARKYFEVGDRLVWANRIHAGTLAGSSAALIPFFKRYFVGGSTSVRGWGRYEVSPLSGSGLPLGGRTMMEVSTEARIGLTGKLSGVVFLDGGNVWTDAWSTKPGGLRWAAGPGIRYNTPIGPVRADLGFQLNPIPGLLVDGKPEARQWRVHFSIGQAF